MGYIVELTKSSNDQGADLIISKLGEKYVVQAKRYSNKVNNKAIQEVVAAIKHYDADRGMVITSNEFTSSAIKLASSNNIDLIDRNKLEKLIKKYF
jgi:HJR/Mrr/RecB family endonuclease